MFMNIDVFGRIVQINLDALCERVKLSNAKQYIALVLYIGFYLLMFR